MTHSTAQSVRNTTLMNRPQSHASIDRRTFVKASAIAATPFLLARVGGAKTPTSFRSDVIKIGLVGCGGRGTGAAANALAADPGVRLHAMGDVFADRIERSLKTLNEDPDSAQSKDRIDVPKDRQFVGFDAFQKVIDSGIDVILLATPPNFRPLHLKYAVDANKHIFCEKPVAVDAPGIRSIKATSELAKSKNLSLVSGLCWRSHQPEREAYKRVHDGAIGEVRAVYATYNGVPNGTVKRTPGMSDVEYQIRNWYHYTWLSGDHILEQDVHSIDKISWALKNAVPTQCTAVGGRAARTSDEPGNGYDHFAVTYEFERGVRGFLMARQIANTPTDNTDYVMGEKGTCYINGWGPTQIIEGPKPWHWEGDAEDMYVSEHKELFAGIRSGKHRWDGDWMTNSSMMGVMGRMAAYTGEVVTWEKAWASVERVGVDKVELGPMTVSSVAVPGKTKFT
jgi:predicted dehydrogenase